MTPDQHRHARRLLEAGVSQRETARRAGVSRDAAAAIAHGQPVAVEAPGRVRRCPGCGAKLKTPTCLDCSIERAQQVNRDLRQLAPLETPR